MIIRQRMTVLPRFPKGEGAVKAVGARAGACARATARGARPPNSPREAAWGIDTSEEGVTRATRVISSTRASLERRKIRRQAGVWLSQKAPARRRANPARIM